MCDCLQHHIHATLQICYSEDNPHRFNLTQVHRVAFIPKVEQGAEVSATSIGLKEAMQYWSSTVSRVIWSVRWTQKGLMPIKPEARLWEEVVLAAGRSCHLTGEAPQPTDPNA